MSPNLLDPDDREWGRFSLFEFAICGTFEGNTQAAVASLIEEADGNVRRRVRDRTDFVVVGKGRSRTLERATHLGTPQVSLEELHGMLDGEIWWSHETGCLVALNREAAHKWRGRLKWS